MTDIDIQACLAQAKAKAKAKLLSNTDNPELEAQILLAHVLDQPRSYLFTWPEKNLSATQLDNFNTLLQERRAGMPIAYLTGVREFWSLPLKVSPDVLIPRPATESLVVEALRLLPHDAQLVADIGTGSGAIALALAKERPNWNISAVDISPAAQAIATGNASDLGIDNVKLLIGSWCEPLDQAQHAIISNPPYIASNDEHLSNTDIKHEPQMALSSGVDGLDAIRILSNTAKHHLLPGGMLMLEHGYQQQAQVISLLSADGYENISGHTDADQLPRFVVAYTSAH